MFFSVNLWTSADPLREEAGSPRFNPAPVSRHGTSGGTANRGRRSTVAANELRETAAPARWKVRTFACYVTLAPILMSFIRKVANDQCCTGFGKNKLQGGAVKKPPSVRHWLGLFY